MQATLAGHIPWQPFTIAASDAPHILTETAGARHCCLLVMYLIPGLQQNIYSCYPLSTTTMANETFRRSVKRSGVPHTVCVPHEVKCPGTHIRTNRCACTASATPLRCTATARLLYMYVHTSTRPTKEVKHKHTRLTDRIHISEAATIQAGQHLTPSTSGAAGRPPTVAPPPPGSCVLPCHSLRT